MRSSGACSKSRPPDPRRLSLFRERGFTNLSTTRRVEMLWPAALAQLADADRGAAPLNTAAPARSATPEIVTAPVFRLHLQPVRRDHEAPMQRVQRHRLNVIDLCRQNPFQLLHLKATRSLPPISGRFMTRRLRPPADRRARLCLSPLLPAFGFESCCEPEFVASTIRPARLLPQFIGQFADDFLHVSHVLSPPRLSPPRLSFGARPAPIVAIIWLEACQFREPTYSGPLLPADPCSACAGATRI